MEPVKLTCAHAVRVALHAAEPAVAMTGGLVAERPSRNVSGSVITGPCSDVARCVCVLNRGRRTMPVTPSVAQNWSGFVGTEQNSAGAGIGDAHEVPA